MSDMPDPTDPSRRNILLVGLGAVAAGVLASCARGGENIPTVAPARSGSSSIAPTGSPTTTTSQATATTTRPTNTTLAATPECVDGDDVTPTQTEGPYFKANSPERTDIRGTATGTRLRLTGTVVTTSCTPVNRALVDFWQADGGGNYDNATFGFRGHQFTDARGRYVLETVVPGLYPGRTRHIHVKVQAPNGRVLTTQLYFPGEGRNPSDGIYNKELEMTVAEAGDGRTGTFQFVLNG